MPKVGQKRVEVLQERLSTPYPPSGPAREGPPAKRTGNLHDGVYHESYADNTVVKETIVSSRPNGDPNVPLYLEIGTSRALERPYIFKARAEAEANVGGELVQHLNSRS